ncbi:MAG: flagellar motor protein MotA [Alphaproteobacteria bacterium]|nr:flagellar motor protein MotA [Alphaproteobacteria bacterium]
MKRFHIAFNRMALFVALVVAGIVLFFDPFMQIATANIVLNGIIIGTTIFGIGLCFVKIFHMLPEYRWLHEYIGGKRRGDLPPRILRPVALMLSPRPARISASSLQNILDMILMRFEEDRESVRYITNTLIFLGLLGTFWGLLLTVGGFADIMANLDMADESVLESMQLGLNRPLIGMATAFTSSILGLGGSLIVGFLGLQVQSVQNSMLHDVEDYFATHTHTATPDVTLGQIGLATRALNKSVQRLDKTVAHWE